MSRIILLETDDSRIELDTEMDGDGFLSIRCEGIEPVTRDDLKQIVRRINVYLESGE